MASRILDRRAVTFGLAGALCMPSIVRAQTNYPDRPINVIVPFAAGGRPMPSPESMPNSSRATSDRRW